MRAVRREQALRVLDDPLEHLVRVRQRRDPGRDVPERPLGLGPASEGHSGPLQLVDQPGVRDRDGRLLGQASEHGRVEVVEGVRPVAQHLDRAEGACLADDRRRDQVADAGPLDERIRQGVVLEIAGKVVAGVDDPGLGHGLARHALAQAQVGHLDRLALLGLEPGVVGPLERPAFGVVLVDQATVGAQQPPRLVDDVLEDLVRFAQGRDPRRDLAQAGLGLRATLDVLAGAGELLHQVRVRDGDRRVRREGGQQLDLGVGVGAGLAGHDRQHAERGVALTGQRHADHGTDAGLAHERLDLGRRLEPVVGQVVLGHDRLLLGEGEAGHGLARLEPAGPPPLGHLGHRVAGRVGPAQRAQLLVPQVDPRTVGAEETRRFRDDPGQDRVGIEDRRDTDRDLAQRPLGVGALGILLARPLELVDEPGVGDGDAPPGRRAPG